MDQVDALRDLVKRADVRTADRASMQTMLKQLQRGEGLSYQDRMNLFAYFSRYGIRAVNDRHF